MCQRRRSQFQGMLVNLKRDTSDGLDGRKMKESNKKCCLAWGWQLSHVRQEDYEFSANMVSLKAA